ncbi:MAG: hypothetical protein C0494_17255 [Sphingobium sp.]|nr:hypothetical protein [Sphingobium sp.]
MGDKILALEQMDTEVIFYHPADERAYFEWLERISCVESVKGDGAKGLVVTLRWNPSDDDLRQLLALAHRYGLDMRKFARFETEANREWFRNPIMYWFEGVFSEEKRSD